MRPFSPRMFQHRVYILPLVEGQDPTGSPTETFPSPSGDPVPCRVRLKGTMAGMFGESDIGTTPAEVAFPSDPGVKVGWKFSQQGNNRILRALGPAQARDADGVLFVVSCMVID